MDNSGRVPRILGILQNYLVPAAADSIYQEAERLLQFRRGDRTVDEYIAEDDLLQRRAGSEMGGGAGFQEQLAPVFRMQNAGVSRASGEVDGGGRQPEGPEVRGRRGEYAKIIRISRRGGPPGCSLRGRRGPGGVRDVRKSNETRGGSGKEGGGIRG